MDSFIIWVRENCPALNLPHGLVAKATESEQQHEDFRILVGAEASRTSQAMLIQRFVGEYFLFPLSESQARLLNAQGSILKFVSAGVRVPSAEPRVCHLEQTTFVEAGGVDLTRPIQGTCVCRFEGSPLPDTCLRLETELRLADSPDSTREVAYYCYPDFGRGEVVEFRVHAPQAGTVCQGPDCGRLLNRLSTPDARQETEARPISNAAGVLATVGVYLGGGISVTQGQPEAE